MKVVVYSTHDFERPHLEGAKGLHELKFLQVAANGETAALARGSDVVCLFANDLADADALKVWKALGVRLVALRCAGFNQVDLSAAEECGIGVVRVPAYSPNAVAEYAVAMILNLNRKIHRAHNRVREGNFSLDGLVGFDLKGKTVGVVGAGRIGQVFLEIMKGFGCELLAFDRIPSDSFMAMGVSYVTLDELCQRSHIISLHLPLQKETTHLIDSRRLSLMKKGALLINTGRGGLIDTKALLEHLKKNHLGGAGLDVYEEEEIFFEDHSGQVIQDDVLARLLTFPNVIVTSHQGFLTVEALKNIATTTFQNIEDYFQGKKTNVIELKMNEGKK